MEAPSRCLQLDLEDAQVGFRMYSRYVLLAL